MPKQEATVPGGFGTLAATEKQRDLKRQGFLIWVPLILLMQTLSAQNAESQKDNCEHRIKQFERATVMDGDLIQWWEKAPAIKGGAKAIAKAIQYPDSALKAGLEGKVLVVMFLSKDNRPECVKILRSENEVFIAEALRVIAGLEYEPATKLGRPIYDVALSLIIEFDKEAYQKNQKKKKKK